MKYLTTSLLFGSLVDQFHKLVKFRCDDDLSAAVTLFAHLGVIGSKRILLVTSTGRETSGIYTIVVL